MENVSFLMDPTPPRVQQGLWMDSSTKENKIFKWTVDGWIPVEGGGGDGSIPQTLLDKINKITVRMKPEVFTKDSVSSTFALSKPPAFVSQVLVSDINNHFFYLQEADYSVSGNSITILDPEFVEGMKISVDYDVQLSNL